MCSKTRAWLIGISADDFRLLQGQEMLSDYQFNRNNIHGRNDNFAKAPAETRHL